MIGKNENLLPTENTNRSGKPDKRSDKKLGQKSSQRRQLGCVFQDMTPPKSILRKGTDMPKPIQRQFTKGVILAHMCVKFQMRLYVCHRVGPVRVHFGSISGPFWVHFVCCLSGDAS